MRFVVLRAIVGDMEGLDALAEPEAAVGRRMEKWQKVPGRRVGGGCNLAALHSLDNVFI